MYTQPHLKVLLSGKQVRTNYCRVSMRCETEVCRAVAELRALGLENTDLALSPKICRRVTRKLTGSPGDEMIRGQNPFPGFVCLQSVE